MKFGGYGARATKTKLDSLPMMVRWIWTRTAACNSRVLLFVFAVVVLIYVSYSVVEDSESFQKEYIEHPVSYSSGNPKYLINTSKCRIPDVDPYNKDVYQYLFKERYIPCTKLGLLTYIEKNDSVVRLRVNTTLLSSYSYFHISCCYYKILRISDTNIAYSACEHFENDTVITHPFIKVACSTFLGEVYSNTHATVIPSKAPKTANPRKNRFSVLLVGIDTISKLNLVRALPKTYAYVEKNFISLRGYNKIGDNTFPNLMAILTGQNEDQLNTKCSKKIWQNHCGIIWDAFKSSGYITGYGEDAFDIGTFYYGRPGFSDPPTDYYYTPYMVASERLGKKMRHRMVFCAGPETSGERILNLAKDFSVSFKNVPIFGLFWMNSFSHDDFNMASAMDEKVLGFLGDTSFRESHDNTILIFFSDHGFRFGNMRYTHTGWLEERLPFIYFHVPVSFRNSYPEKFKNFLVNTKRLTTPYDIHNTLQDILRIGNDEYKTIKSPGCKNCHTLFEEVAESRTCKLAAIEQHWCTCTGHHYINPNETFVRSVATFVIEQINGVVKSFTEGLQCADYTLNKVVSAGISEHYRNEKNETVYYLLVIIRSEPGAMFEATVEAYVNTVKDNFKLLGDVSRVDSYGENSFCVGDTTLRKYCYCDGYVKKHLRLLGKLLGNVD